MSPNFSMLHEPPTTALCRMRALQSHANGPKLTFVNFVWNDRKQHLTDISTGKGCYSASVQNGLLIRPKKLEPQNLRSRGISGSCNLPQTAATIPAPKLPLSKLKLPNEFLVRVFNPRISECEYSWSMEKTPAKLAGVLVSLLGYDLWPHERIW